MPESDNSTQLLTPLSILSFAVIFKTFTMNGCYDCVCIFQTEILMHIFAGTITDTQTCCLTTIIMYRSH